MQLYIHRQNNTRTYRGIKLKPSSEVLSYPVIYCPVSSCLVPFVSCQARSRRVQSCHVLSRPIVSCLIRSDHVTLSPLQNLHFRVTNIHTQHHNLTVTTTSHPVPFVSCRFRSCRVLSPMSCPVLSCHVPTNRVLSFPVRSHHTQSVAEFAFSSNKHT